MQIEHHFGITERISELAENLKELGQAVYKGRDNVDLCKADFVTPLSILPLAVYASNNGIGITCSEKKHDIQSYLNTIGFPDGFETLPASSKRYLPITKLPPIEKNQILGEYEDLILEMASSREYADSFKLSLKYLTSELVNNVNEHAETDHYWLLAQYWEQPRKTCEIVIADCGIGYRASYEGTKFEVKTDKQAIINALLGKSSKREDRGAGIPSIARVFINGYRGKLIIMSGKSIIYDKLDRRGNRKRNEWKLKSNWQGSLVGLNFDLKEVDLYKYLE